jgi:hypothetical protein
VRPAAAGRSPHQTVIGRRNRAPLLSLGHCPCPRAWRGRCAGQALDTSASARAREGQRRRARARQALENRGGAADRARAEKQLIALLALPLARPDAVAVLGLSAYPRVMSLLAPSSRKARGPPPAPPGPRWRGAAAPAARPHGLAARGQAQCAGRAAPAAPRHPVPVSAFPWFTEPRAPTGNAGCSAPAAGFPPACSASRVQLAAITAGRPEQGAQHCLLALVWSASKDPQLRLDRAGPNRST